MVRITLSERNEMNMVELVVQGIGEWRGQNNVIQTKRKEHGGVRGAGTRAMRGQKQRLNETKGNMMELAVERIEEWSGVLKITLIR